MSDTRRGPEHSSPAGRSGRAVLWALVGGATGGVIALVLLGRTPGSEGWMGFVHGGTIGGFVGGLVGGAWAGLRRRGTAKRVA